MMAKYSDELLLAARIALGLIFVLSGFNKLVRLEGFAASLVSRGVPRLYRALRDRRRAVVPGSPVVARTEVAH
jgi:uncharacterized membrane protein YphA (DoxX/SURF4 family)